MALRVAPLSSARDLEIFVDLPFRIHRTNPLWIPPLKKQERDLLSPEHPFWESASRELFIAWLDGEPVGRIAAIVDAKYNSYAREACGAFGFFECSENMEAAFALLASARSWLEERGMAFMRGPLNPSTNYTCGMLVSGFELPPALMMPWNPPHYPRFLETWGLRKEEDLFAYIIEKDNFRPQDWVREQLARVKAEGRFTCRRSSKKTIASDIAAMLDIYARSWADNWGFSPLSRGEADLMVRELKPVLDPDFFALFFHKGEPAAGMVALPNLNPLLKRLNGKIGLSAPWHWWRSAKNIRQGYRIMLFGILPEFRLYGLPMLLLDYILEMAAKKPDLRWMEGSWVLEDNPAIDDLIEDFGGRLVKRYRIYRAEILKC